MDYYHLNHIHALLETSLNSMGVTHKTIFMEDEGPVVVATIYFNRLHSNHPDVTHRIGLWATPKVSLDEITGALLDAFEEEWQDSIEAGWD